jgi:hypothetical protein
MVMTNQESPPNAFSPEFLDGLREQDDVLTADEATYAGPWKVEALEEGGYAVLRSWESVESGFSPFAVFTDRETALLATAILPAVGREPLFLLDEAAGPDGYALRAVVGERGVQVVGRLQLFDTAAVQGLHLAQYLARSPEALACLLEATGPESERRVGEILFRQLGR